MFKAVPGGGTALNPLGVSSMKQRITLISAFVLIFALFAGGSVAYFTHETEFRSVISTGTIRIELTDRATYEDRIVALSASDSVLPGDTIEQSVSVHNRGDHAAWIRIKLATNQGSEPSATELPFNPDINMTQWIQNGAWYYSIEALEPECSQSLFSSINIPMSVGNSYQEQAFSLSIHAEAVQVVHNGNDGVSAVGWPSS